jgi:hypothetical protein
MSKKHTFDLKITASKLNEIHMKYDLKKSALASNDTSNTTKIDIEATDTLNFLDETRKLHKCILAKIDFGSLEGYKCFWCRNVCPPEKTPVGCPTKYISPVVYRNYFSEINKEKFVVKESCLKTDKIVVSDDIAVENNDYYESDGIFCDLSCALAFVRDNKKNPLYAESELLIHRIAGKKVEPAPHWRLLKEYGGILDIKEFRDSFHHTEFQPFGVCAKPFFQSVAHTFESKIKF